MLNLIKKLFDISGRTRVFRQYLLTHTHALSSGVFLLALLFNSVLVHANEQVTIVYEQPRGFILQVIESIEQGLHSSGYTTSRLNLDTDPADKQHLETHQLLIAVGSKATKHMLDSAPQTPILSVLMPKHLAVSLQQLYPDKHNWSSLLIDQPLERQFHLITSIFGEHQKTGVLLGPYTDIMMPSLKKAAKETGHKLTAEKINTAEDINASLMRLNNTSSVLLTLPDPLVFNNNTIRGILLSSYRNRLPIIGFSHAYVKAGAVAAVYSEPEQISTQAVKISIGILEGRGFEKKRYYPEDFSIALNYKVARSLGISLDSSSEIHTRIRQAEK